MKNVQINLIFAQLIIDDINYSAFKNNLSPETL